MFRKSQVLIVTQICLLAGGFCFGLSGCAEPAGDEYKEYSGVEGGLDAEESLTDSSGEAKDSQKAMEKQKTDQSSADQTSNPAGEKAKSTASEQTEKTQQQAASETQTPEEKKENGNTKLAQSDSTEAKSSVPQPENKLADASGDSQSSKKKMNQASAKKSSVNPLRPSLEQFNRGANPRGRPAPNSQGANKENESDKPREVKLLVKNRNFKVEGPDGALRVTYDDIDLLKVLNMDPVTPKAPDLMPAWLKNLDGKRIRIRGFMYPSFQDRGLEKFILARDNQICCFGRNPKIYDVFPVDLKDGVTTDYIQGRPFDVVGVFHIDPQIESGEIYQLYRMDDAIVID